MSHSHSDDNEREGKEGKKVCCRERHREAYAESSRSTARKIDRGGWANLLALHDTCPLCNWSERERKGGYGKKQRGRIAGHAGGHA